MKAKCQCGQLSADVPAPTQTVVACHCLGCQKRFGSLFGQAAYYPHDEVEVSGEAHWFTRPTAVGGSFDQFFCPHCGSTVYMHGTKNPDVTGIPIGLFDEAHAMRPIRSVWEERRHDWVEITSAVQHFPHGRVD